MFHQNIQQSKQILGFNQSKCVIKEIFGANRNLTLRCWINIIIAFLCDTTNRAQGGIILGPLYAVFVEEMSAHKCKVRQCKR